MKEMCYKDPPDLLDQSEFGIEAAPDGGVSLIEMETAAPWEAGADEASQNSLP